MEKRVVVYMSLLTVLFFAAGCACRMELKKAAPPAPAPGEIEKARPSPPTGLATPEEQQKALGGEEIPGVKIEGKVRETTAEEKEVFGVIFFDFDKSDIRPDARPVLAKMAAYIKTHPELDIVIEGNCDERGTEEYNMALGERRALSTRRYLIALGVASGRMATVSYGEERPIDPGHNETAWAKNRNCQFKIIE